MAQLLKIIDELEAKAKAATPGPWEYQTYSNYPNGYSVHNASGGCIAERWQDGLTDMEAERLRETGNFIAACSPDVILQLCTALREAREVIEFIAVRQSYPSLDETIKARAFLKRWNTPFLDRE